MTKKKQNTDNGSLGIQSDRDTNLNVIVNNGISAAEAIALAKALYVENITKFTEVAKQVAQERAEEIVNKFVETIQKEYPNGLSQAADPSFQDDLFLVQKEYAKTGDKNLGDLLVNLLVDRSKSSERDLLQIVLSESIKTAPKVTDKQLNMLSLFFLFRNTAKQDVGTHLRLAEYFDRFVKPFIGSLNLSSSDYQHLEFTSCASVELTSVSLESLLSENYRGLFFKGLTVTELKSMGLSDETISLIFCKCVNGLETIQIAVLNRGALDELILRHSINPTEKGIIEAIYENNKMTDSEISELCCKLRGYMKEVFETWKSTPLKSLSLSSVGIALAYANIKRASGEFADLKIWIN